MDYEYWYFSYQNLFRMEPDVKGWRKELDEDYDILDIMVFAEFSSNQRLQNQITPLRNITNTIIEKSPMVYKPMEEIIQGTKDTVTIDRIIKPIYNFKAGENASKRSPRHS